MDRGDREIVLVEDDVDAAHLMLRALEKSDPRCTVHILQDGERAIAYLSARMADPAAPLSSLVITDLKMPRKSGFDVISWIRTQPRLSSLPVVVLSASNEAADVDRAMSLGANGYFVKPLLLADLLELAKSLVDGKIDFQTKKN
jgi:CheY-like chemotaxis protein